MCPDVREVRVAIHYGFSQTFALVGFQYSPIPPDTTETVTPVLERFFARWLTSAIVTAY
jgi:hypothetical protein